MQEEIKEGDYVKGSWLDEATGKTYYSEGTVIKEPAGLFVEDPDRYGITPLKDFFHITSVNGRAYVE
jgi:hypothetical protein